MRYQTERWFVEVGYNGSFYSNNASSFDWTTRSHRIVPGGDEGRMALAPDNGYNELALSAGMHGLPGNTTVAISAAAGKGTQDAKFLPYTINPDITTQPLPMSNLDGYVDVTRADLTVTSRPWSSLRLRGSVTYDESKDDSKQAAFDSIVYTDIFPLAGARPTRSTVSSALRAVGSADYDVFKDRDASASAANTSELKRTGTKQEISKENSTDGWGRIEYRPSGYLGIVLRGGAQERKPGQVRPDAWRRRMARTRSCASTTWRTCGAPTASSSPTSRWRDLPVTLSASAFYADDSYTQSQIGLRSGLDPPLCGRPQLGHQREVFGVRERRPGPGQFQAGEQQQLLVAGLEGAGRTTRSTRWARVHARSSPTT